MDSRVKPQTLNQWLDYQQQVHAQGIELGLDRVREVWQRMGGAKPAPCVITVGGTNGKGSTVAFLEAMLAASGLRVGAYTSPHLMVYNERVRIAGRHAEDDALVASFERIERARGSVSLTYFEFGTLAALDLFSEAKVDVALLEVGLGGRLDAVNIIEPDAVVITTVDLDHVEWLGPDRDSIGREKAGIARRDKPAIIGESDSSEGLLGALAQKGARIERAGTDFHVERRADDWHWQHRDGTAMDLPNPTLAAPIQWANAAAAIAVLHALAGDAQGSLFNLDLADVAAKGLTEVRLSGRLQSLGGNPSLHVDVGHNPQAARALAEWLDAQPSANVHAVYGALSDKDVGGVMAALGARITHWHLAGLEQDTPRGLSADVLSRVLTQVLPKASFDRYPDVARALGSARAAAGAGDRILAFGSFFVASAVLAQASG